MALTLIRPTDASGLVRNLCRMALRLSGLRKAKHGAQPLPDGAALIRPTKDKARCVTFAGWRCAYPAYKRQSTVRNLCRMALRLSGLRTAKPGAQPLPDGAALIRPTKQCLCGHRRRSALVGLIRRSRHQALCPQSRRPALWEY